MQGKGLRLRVNSVVAVFRYDAVKVSDVKPNNGVINAVARTDSGNACRVLAKQIGKVRCRLVGI
jgi:hypothetical protein